MSMKSETPSKPSANILARPAHGAEVLERLWTSLDSHFRTQSPVPARTARLTAGGRQKMAKKLVEEAGEAALAAAVTDRAEFIAESADLLYHLTVLWASLEIAPDEIWAEMQAREAVYGLAEKRAKHAELYCDK
jgi:phosphoribosyl-ATP pyrophosphohydrolase